MMLSEEKLPDHDAVSRRPTNSHTLFRFLRALRRALSDLERILHLDEFRPSIRADSSGEGPMRVGDLIGSRKEIYTVSEETSVHQVAQYLRTKGVRTVGVLDATGKLAGVISQSDISDKVAAENKCPAWMKASDIMTRELVTVTAERSLDECLLLMEENGIFHLIVLNERGEFRGMLSVKDILRVVASDEKARADLLEAFIFPPR
jgi:CBS domain-containing protein